MTTRRSSGIPSASTRSAIAASAALRPGGRRRRRRARAARDRARGRRSTGSPDRRSRRRTGPPARRGRAAPARSRHQPSGRAPMTLLPSTIQRPREWSDRPLRCSAWVPGHGFHARRCRLRVRRASCGGSTTTAENATSSGSRGAAGLRRGVDELSQGITATSSAARDRRTLRSFEEAVDEVGGELLGIRPPGRSARSTSASSPRRRLRRRGAGGRAHARDLQEASQLRGAQRELAQATTAFGTTLNETIDEINRELMADSTTISG